jgi:hypothetical protein
MSPREPSLDDAINEWHGKLAKHYAAYRRAQQLSLATDSQLRLMFGEMTALEIRDIRAATNYILGNAKEEKASA